MKISEMSSILAQCLLFTLCMVYVTKIFPVPPSHLSFITYSHFIAILIFFFNSYLKYQRAEMQLIVKNISTNAYIESEVKL